MCEASFQTAAELLDGWRDDIYTGKPPVLFPAGTGDLKQIEIGPGLVTLMGGAPGAGKTALAMQLQFDALRLNPSLRAVVCNVEMPPEILLDRQLARLTGVDLTLIRHRRLDERHADALDQGFATLEPVCERLAFVRPPFTLENVAVTADAFGADLILLDYLQRISPGGEHSDRRGAVNLTMEYLRQFAHAGVAIFAIAAVGRTRDQKGRSSYDGDGLNLASFRESSELEFGADDAFILVPSSCGENVTLRHLKSRHGEPKDITLSFNRKLQRFSSTGDSSIAPAHEGNLTKALADLWQTTTATSDFEENE